MKCCRDNTPPEPPSAVPPIEVPPDTQHRNTRAAAAKGAQPGCEGAEDTQTDTPHCLPPRSKVLTASSPQAAAVVTAKHAELRGLEVEGEEAVDPIPDRGNTGGIGKRRAIRSAAAKDVQPGCEGSEDRQTDTPLVSPNRVAGTTRRPDRARLIGTYYRNSQAMAMKFSGVL